MRRPEVTPLVPDFEARWHGWFPDTPPVGFLLRDVYPDRWLRVHSLPASKRYATTGREHAEVIRRYNALANEMFGDGSNCALVLLTACDRNSIALAAEVSCVDAKMMARLALLPENLWDADTGVFAEPMCVSGIGVTWRERDLDSFLGATANGDVRGLLVEVKRGRTLAPYDGGADLFFPSEAERDTSRAGFVRWLSSHPEGL